MANKTLPKITDEEFAEADRRGLQSAVGEVHASAARYDQTAQLLVLTLRGGLTAFVPTHLLQGVAGANAKDIAEVELWGEGSSLHWEKLDADFSVQSVLAGSFGTRAWMQKLEEQGLLDQASLQRRRDVDVLLGRDAARMGRKGGAARTSAKIAASRDNGSKGGRPRKTPVVTTKKTRQTA